MILIKLYFYLKQSYKFEFENNHELPSSEMTFSSYPGCLSSTDDFYITNNNLVITETTLFKKSFK